MIVEHVKLLLKQLFPNISRQLMNARNTKHQGPIFQSPLISR